MQGRLAGNTGTVYFPPDGETLHARAGTDGRTGTVAVSTGTVPDSTKTKKFIAFSEKKKASLIMCEFAAKTVTLAALDIDTEAGEIPMGAHMTDKMLERIRGCSSWVEFAAPEDFAKLKKIEGFVCKNAFCPVCAAYQSRRDGLKLSVMMDAMQDLKNIDVTKAYGADVAALPFIDKAMKKGVEFIMLGLSSPNVTGDKLKQEEKKYAKAFNRMMDHWFSREYSDYYLGHVRKLEVTYNRQKVITQEMWNGTGKYSSPWKYRFRHMGLKVGDRNPFFNTYNPHYHVIIAVTSDFFSIAEDGTERMAFSREQLLSKWVELMGDPDIKKVDVRKVYKTRGEGNSAVSEIAKYVAKDSDMLYSPKVFRTFYEALKGTKRMTFGGIFRVFHRLFKDGELVRYLPIDETVYKWAVHYEWYAKSYGEKKRRELTPEEAAKIACMKYSEANDTDDF